MGSCPNFTYMQGTKAYLKTKTQPKKIALLQNCKRLILFALVLPRAKGIPHRMEEDPPRFLPLGDH